MLRKTFIYLFSIYQELSTSFSTSLTTRGHQRLPIHVSIGAEGTGCPHYILPWSSCLQRNIYILCRLPEQKGHTGNSRQESQPFPKGFGVLPVQCWGSPEPSWNWNTRAAAGGHRVGVRATLRTASCLIPSLGVTAALHPIISLSVLSPPSIGRNYHRFYL